MDKKLEEKVETQSEKEEKKEVQHRLELTVKLFAFIGAFLTSISNAQNETLKITTFVDWAKFIEPVKKEFPSFTSTNYLTKDQFKSLDKKHQNSLTKLFTGKEDGFINILFDWIELTKKLL